MAPEPEEKAAETPEGCPMSDEQALKLSAEQRRCKEKEVARLKAENDENARRVEYVKAKVHAYLGGGRAAQ